jgi:hypothetical protein
MAPDLVIPSVEQRFVIECLVKQKGMNQNGWSVLDLPLK